LPADVLRHELVERDAEVHVVHAFDVIGMHAVEQRELGAVVIRVAEVRHAGEDGELAALRFEDLQKPRCLVVEPCFFGEKIRRICAERTVEDDHAARGHSGSSGGAAKWAHGVEQRQCEGGGPGLEEGAAVEMAFRDVQSVHWFKNARLCTSSTMSVRRP
jgi:hypothetical protein